MKEALAYLAVAVLMLFVLASLARADTRVAIINKCDGVADRLKCYYKTQGSSNEYRLEAWQDLKEQAIKRGYKLPKKVFLIDPVKEGRGVWNYKTYLRGKHLYFAPMQPCRHVDRREGLKALARLR